MAKCVFAVLDVFWFGTFAKWSGQKLGTVRFALWCVECVSLLMKYCWREQKQKKHLFFPLKFIVRIRSFVRRLHSLFVLLLVQHGTRTIPCSASLLVFCSVAGPFSVRASRRRSKLAHWKVTESENEPIRTHWMRGNMSNDSVTQLRSSSKNCLATGTWRSCHNCARFFHHEYTVFVRFLSSPFAIPQLAVWWLLLPLFSHRLFFEINFSFFRNMSNVRIVSSYRVRGSISSSTAKTNARSVGCNHSEPLPSALYVFMNCFSFTFLLFSRCTFFPLIPFIRWHRPSHHRHSFNRLASFAAACAV